MVANSGYVLLALLLPWIVSSIRGRLDLADPPEEVPKNEDRLQCLRQDNLDLVGTRDFDERFVVRMVLGVHEQDTDSDVYLFAEKFRFSRVHAELKLTRTGADALEFELVGDDSIGQNTGLGQADLWLSGFQVVTESTIINWASSLAANRDALAKGQNGTVHFDLAGKIHAKKKKGSWVAELFQTKVRYFSFSFENQQILDFALNRFGGIDQLLLDNLFKLVETAVPINLLASMQFLPLRDGRPPELQDLWLSGRMKLSGQMTEVNGDLALESSFDLTAHTVPARLLDVLIHNFDVEHLAEELVGAFLADPKVAKALQTGGKNLIENLREYRFVVSDQLKSLTEKEVNLESLRPVLLEQARKITSDLLVQFLQPFLKAHAEGKSDYFRGFNVQLGGGLHWDSSAENGLPRVQLHPRKLKLQAGLDDDENPLYSFAEAPLELADALALLELLPKLPVEGEMAEVEFKAFEYDSNQISLALAAIRNWAQKPDANASANATAKWQIIVAEVKDIALRLPQAWALPFALSCMGGQMAINHSGTIQLLSRRSGIEVRQTQPLSRPSREGPQRISKVPESADGLVPAEFQRPTSSQSDMTVVDRIEQVGGSGSVDVVGNDKGSLQIKIGGTLQMRMDAKSVAASAMAALPIVDFGYVFFADEFTWYKSSGKVYKVMAVLSCGYLRLLQWPLRSDPLKRLEMKTEQLQFDLAKMTTYPTLEDKELGLLQGPCLLLERKKDGLLWGSSDVTERLCAARSQVQALGKAIAMQLRRFDTKFHNPQAVDWRYGTHVAGKPQYVLPQDTVQTNLLTVLDRHTWSKTVGGSSHPAPARPALLEIAASRISSKSVAEGQGMPQHERAQGHWTALPRTLSQKGSFESKACRAQEELDSIRYPPEKYGNASIRMVIPATPIGDVHFLIEKIQVVSLDIAASLVRNSDTTFSFELGGSDGPGTVNVYVQGIKFKAPDSAVPGITKAAAKLDSFLRPVFTLGISKADSLKEGPLKASFKMKGEFKLSEGGHWEVLPKAVSDVKLVFGRGGLVQGLINHLVDAYGNMDEIFLTSVWPVLASAIPESLGQAFVQIPRRVGQLRHNFNIQGRCLVPHEEEEERCATDQVSIVFQDVTATAILPKPLAEKYLVSQNCSKSCEAVEQSLPMLLLQSYVNSSEASVFDGTSTETGLQVDYSVQDFTKIRLDGGAVAPMKLLEIGLGNGSNLLANLLPAVPGKLTSVGSLSLIEGNKVVIPEARLERLRLPLLLDGQKEALELNLTLSKVTAISDGPDSSILDVIVGYFDLTLDRVLGLVFKSQDSHYDPLLDITVNRTYINNMISAVEHAWPQPLNVRTAAASRPDGEVPEAFRQKQSIVPGELDMHKTMPQAHLGASLNLVGEVDAASGEDLLNVSAGVVLRATLDLGSAFWRAVVTCREKDFGFVHASRRGVWGALEHSRLPTQRVLLDIGCGQLRIFDDSAGAEPYGQLVHSADLYDLWRDQEFDPENTDYGPCMFITETFWHKNYFCAEAKSIKFVREALSLQLARFSSIAASVVDAQAQDVESFAALRTSGYKALTPSKPAEVFADSTWFRQLNPIDRTSWAPDLPPAQAGEVETPLQRWKRAEK